MSYCVGLRLEKGLVFMADTLTNAGVDNISHYQKVFTWSKKDKAQVFLLTAGNLATSQAVVNILDGNGNTSNRDAAENPAQDILALPNMFQIAKLVAETLRSVIGDMQGLGQEASSQFDVTMILGGQIFGEDTKLFLIYPEGNFIEVSDDQPFFQVGETKYGKPILVRAYDEKLDFEDAVKLLLLSFDSTMKANLSVGLPLDLVIYERDSFTISHRERITQDNAYFQYLSNAWGTRLKNAFEELPDFEIIATK